MTALRVFDVLEGATPKDVAFFSGAGLSIPRPTQLPSGIALTEQMMTWAFFEDPLDLLVGPRDSSGRRDSRQGLYTALNIEGRPVPRLEVVLGIIADVFGADVLSSLLAPIKGAAPNHLHEFMSRHCQDGGFHLTANFDTCIERAHAASVDSRIVHFHGSIEDNVLSLGARLASVENGFDAVQGQQIVSVLCNSKITIVYGYSGLDVFDVAPLLRDLPPGMLSGREVLWLDFGMGDLVEVEEDRTLPSASVESRCAFLAEERVPWAVRQRGYLENAGAKVTLLRGDSEILLRFLAERWSYHMVARPHGSRLQEALPAANPSLSIQATGRLFAHLGLEQKRSDLQDRFPSLFSECERRECAATVAWQQGEYRRAKRIWRSRPRETPEARAAWDERQIACDWAAGRFGFALVRAHLSLRRLRRLGLEDDSLVQTYGRVIQHMKRTPDMAWIARRYEDRALRAAAESLSRFDIGEHQRLGLGTVVAALTSGDGEQQSTAVARFMESESLTGVVNYRHGRLRALTQLVPAPAERYEDQARWFRALGLTGDARRVLLLPGAPASTSEVVRALLGNQFGHAQRLRIFARHCSLVLSSRVRRLRP